MGLYLCITTQKIIHPSVFLFNSWTQCSNATIWKNIVKPMAEKTNATISRYDRVGFGKSRIKQHYSFV